MLTLPKNNRMETFGFCNLSCVPLRAAASHRSEMVSQLLFGDTFEIMGTEDSWLAVQCSHDDYQGFIDEIGRASCRERV